uniref:Uncharacterized protein n=1 Tax=Panagrolaimus sp. JU765 TaxID=591449 RepID=A0AC34Q4H1_9BILA
MPVIFGPVDYFAWLFEDKRREVSDTRRSRKAILAGNWQIHSFWTWTCELSIKSFGDGRGSGVKAEQVVPECDR